MASSTRSRGLPRGGNRARGAVRCLGRTALGAKGRVLSGRRRREPSESKPDSASLHKSVVTNLPEVVKSETCGEARSESTCRATRGDWGGHASKERSRNLGDPVPSQGSGRAARDGALGLQVAACGERGVSDSAQAPHPEPAGLRQRRRGIHNPSGGGSRESEQPITARKRGNARGAKGLYFSRVYTKERRPA